MTRLIQDDGRVIPLTVVECAPNVVVQVKTVAKDGYPALVLGFDALKKPTKNKKFRIMREIRVEEGSDYKAGDAVSLDLFEVGDSAKITSTSKGKGFQGVVKRHHFRGGPRTHGSHFKREPGAIGARARPGKVFKGMKMAGHMGLDTCTIEDVEIVYVDKAKNLIGIKGPVAGTKGSLVIIRKN